MASSSVYWILIGNLLAPSTSSCSREGYAFKLPTNPGMRTVTCHGSRLFVEGMESAKSHSNHFIWILTTITRFYKLQTSGFSSHFIDCPQINILPPQEGHLVFQNPQRKARSALSQPKSWRPTTCRYCESGLKSEHICKGFRLGERYFVFKTISLYSLAVLELTDIHLPLILKCCD